MPYCTTKTKALTTNDAWVKIVFMKRYVLYLVAILFLGGCGLSEKEAKQMQEEIRNLREQNSYMKAELVGIKKEREQIYKKLEELEVMQRHKEPDKQVSEERARQKELEKAKEKERLLEKDKKLITQKKPVSEKKKIKPVETIRTPSTTKPKTSPPVKPRSGTVRELPDSIPTRSGPGEAIHE